MEGHEEAALAIEVEQLLSALSEYNERMAQCVNNGKPCSKAVFLTAMEV